MIDPTFQPLSTPQREGSTSQPQAEEQTDLAPRCRSILPKRQRRCRQPEGLGNAKRSRRSPQTLRQEFVFGPSTLIEKLDSSGKAIRPRQLAGLLGIGRSTLYE